MKIKSLGSAWEACVYAAFSGRSVPIDKKTPLSSFRIPEGDASKNEDLFWYPLASPLEYFLYSPNKVPRIPGVASMVQMYVECNLSSSPTSNKTESQELGNLDSFLTLLDDHPGE